MTKNILLSNAKGLLIFLVVFGHFLRVDRQGLELITLSIYSFHMPAFIFLSGYFAKRVSIRKIVNLCLLYVLFTVLYVEFVHLTNYWSKLSFTYAIVAPIYQLWYLVSLASFYLLALFLNRIRKIKPLTAAVIVVLLVVSITIRWGFNLLMHAHPTLPLGLLSIQRTFVFLPFFLGGLYTSNEQLEYFAAWLRKIPHKIVYASIVILLVALILREKQSPFENLFYGFMPSNYFATNFYQYLLMILLQYALATTMTIAALAALNSKKNILTGIGDNSLEIFLFHYFVFIIMDIYAAQLMWLGPLERTCLAVVVATLTCWTSIYLSRWLNWLTHPLDTSAKLGNKIVQFYRFLI